MTATALVAIALGAVLLVAVLVGVVRFSGLNRRLGSFECSVVRPSGAARRGLAVYCAGRIEWWPLWSLSVRPAAVWRRGRLVVVDRNPTGRPEESLYLVEGTCGGHPVVLLMSREAYSGLTSWLEAAPSGHGSVV
ncbi:hypothetical protein GCM10025865_22680 [Paraoerskovia sediminicola]|uniref:DUF2550 family protein n=1 Tax=Paraoerskovia sediminicola TaxID=1138587 RepID=A0ABM8G4L2_9CELL|nr:DUF2550 family protein [Paraoerskovia sediminicola]BDZ42969.1 hypothetical protein GCM10025865_22680 [Paraoerskovia sediminicola]